MPYSSLSSCLVRNIVSVPTSSFPSFEKGIFACTPSILQSTTRPSASTSTATTFESACARPSSSPASFELPTELITASPVESSAPAGTCTGFSGAGFSCGCCDSLPDEACGPKGEYPFGRLELHPASSEAAKTRLSAVAKIRFISVPPSIVTGRASPPAVA